MYSLFQGIKEIECFINDIAIFSNGTFKDHIRILKDIPTRLEEAGFTVNPLKFSFSTRYTNYQVFQLIPEGIKPMKKKVELIL